MNTLFYIPIGLAVYTPIVLGAARLCGLNSRPVEQEKIDPRCTASRTPRRLDEGQMSGGASIPGAARRRSPSQDAS